MDRLARVLVAEILFVFAFFWLAGVWAIIVYVLSAVMLFTSIIGFCALYTLFHLNTKKNTEKVTSKWMILSFVFIFIVVAVAGGYASNFFTKKIFIEDYNQMNQHYKQTLFFTGQEKRAEAVDNYVKLVSGYGVFEEKYQTYRPYAVSWDMQFTSDIKNAREIISNLGETVRSGDLKSAHLELEKVRPIFQELLKRNGFSMLAISLVDFHDVMEKIITMADAKNPAGLIAVYPEVDGKLNEVEILANDSEIQAIRQKLEEVLTLAKEGKSDALSAKAVELKSAFVKVYLKRG